MFGLRIVTSRRLDVLARDLEGARRDVEVLRWQLRDSETHLAMTQQAFEHFKDDAKYWKGVASRFIDQIALSDGKLTAPAMQEPPPAPPNPARQVMAAIGIQELPKHKHAGDTRPDPASFLGVNEHAAAAALGNVLND